MQVRTFRWIVVLVVIMLSGCVTIPQESVELNKSVTSGITAIHESNIRLIDQYFAAKITEIDKYEREELDNFFKKVVSAAAKPGAPDFEVKDLYSIKEQVERIHAQGLEYKKALNASRDMVVEKLRTEYNAVIAANSSITGILQSAVDVDKATNDGLSTVKKLSGGKIDMTDIDNRIDDYLSKLGSASSRASSLIEKIQESLDKSKGD